MIDDQLFAQGYKTDGVDDGGGLVRPYLNAIHDHFGNSPGASESASADLPGYDIPDGIDALDGYDVTWTLTGAWKWVGPPMMPPAGTEVVQTPLDTGDTVYVTRGASFVSTDSPGSLLLVNYAASGGVGGDLDLTYDIDLEPSDVLYVIESVLSTTAPGIADSETIYTILSPDPAVGGLHHASLYLEQQLGIVPEPASLTLLALGGGLALARRRRA